MPNDVDDNDVYIYTNIYDTHTRTMVCYTKYIIYGVVGKRRGRRGLEEVSGRRGEEKKLTKKQKTWPTRARAIAVIVIGRHITYTIMLLNMRDHAATG